MNRLEQCVSCIEERLILLEEGRNNRVVAFGGSLKRQRQPISVLVDTDEIERLESIAIVPDRPCRDVRSVSKLTL
jgi:hypothetical protein